jgi:sec-independent protein translocase protein TatC
VFFIAAILTPPDAVSMVSMALITYALYEVGIVWASWLVRNRTTDQAANNIQQT